MVFNLGNFLKYAGQGVTDTGAAIFAQDKLKQEQARQAAIDAQNAKESASLLALNDIKLANEKTQQADTLTAKEGLGRFNTLQTAPLTASTTKDLTEQQVADSLKTGSEPSYVRQSPLESFNQVGLNTLQNVPAVEKMKTDLDTQADAEAKHNFQQTLAETQNKFRMGEQKERLDAVAYQKELDRQARMGAQDAKDNAKQDALEFKTRDKMMSLRNDKSLARTEEQRDAAIQAYNTISSAKTENRPLSQLEYYDVLGQMWKARTGVAPTEQSIRDLDQKTFRGNMAKAFQYITGQSTGMTTESVLNSIQDFAKKSGQQADRLHEGYMKSRMIKPTGLDEARWQPISEAGHGISFDEATRQHDEMLKASGAGNEGGSTSAASDLEAIRARRKALGK